MPSNLEALQNALDLAKHDAAHWRSVSDAVVNLFGATGAILVPANPDFRGVWMSCSTRLGETLEEYIAGEWHLKDPREKVTSLMIEHGFATDDDIFPDRATKEATPFYRDFLIPHDFGVLITVRIIVRIMTPNGPWGLMLHFANDHPPISPAEEALITTVRPLFEAAAAEGDAASHRQIAGFAQFFRKTEADVFIFDAHGKECLAMDHNGKIRTHDRLAAFIPDEMATTLGEELKQICASDPGLSLSKAYQFRVNGRYTNMLVIQIPPALRHFWMPFKVCAILTECGDTNALKHTRLRDEYGLTRSEVATVDLLASGKTPSAIADLLSLKPTSVRQRLKQVYEKTHVSGQVELVAFFADL